MKKLAEMTDAERGQWLMALKKKLETERANRDKASDNYRRAIDQAAILRDALRQAEWKIKTHAREIEEADENIDSISASLTDFNADELAAIGIYL